jgi:hypothetical protein
MLKTTGAAAAAFCVFALGMAGQARADSGVEKKYDNAFEHPFGLGAYTVAQTGDYDSVGVGGRLRFEPLPWIGLDLFGEIHAVDWPGSFRHDYPVGFNLYVPISLTEWLRVRPLAGLCAAFSFIEPASHGGPRADDVLFGAHGGLGLEAAFGTELSAFVDAQSVLWFGHDRTVQGWQGDVAEEVEATTLYQVSLGLTLHL